MSDSAMINMPPQPCVRTLRFERLPENPGSHSLEFQDASRTVYSGPHCMRFESPEAAAGRIVSWTELKESNELGRELAEAKTPETKGRSDVWLPVVYELYHLAGPVLVFNDSACLADGGHQSAQIPHDPEHELPEECDLLLRAHDREDRGRLVSPDGEISERVIVWSSYTWEKSISRIYHPVVEVKYDDGEKETFMLLRGPYRRNSDKAILMPAPEGEYRIEWEEVPDFGRS